MFVYMNFVLDVFVNFMEFGKKKVREFNGLYVFLFELIINEYINLRLFCDIMKIGFNFDFKGYGIVIFLNLILKLIFFFYKV